MVAALRRAGAQVTLCAPKGIDDPDVIEIAHPTFPAVPPSYCPIAIKAEVPESIGSKTANWLRRNLLLPDPEIRWALRIAKVVQATGRKFDWVLTSSPPESLHVAGAILKSRLDVSWAAEARDHWIAPPQRPQLLNNPLRAEIERIIAKRCFNNVSVLIGVSRFVIDEVEKYAPPKTPSLVIEHFAEPYVGVKERLPSDRFNLVHTGAIGISNPLSEFRAMLGDFEGLAAVRSDATLWLAGALNSAEMSQINASIAKAQIKILGPVSMQRARALQSGADVLVLVSGQKSTALPGKFAEYALTKKPIVLSAVGPWTRLLPDSANLVLWSDLIFLQKGLPEGTSKVAMQNPADWAAVKLLEFLSVYRPIRK
jgi:hypothetical protein